MAQEKRPITAEDLYRLSHVEDPRVSPDGKWVAFVKVAVDKVENGYKRNIWLVDTNGGEPFQVTRGGKDSSPRWSPDGKQLAFVSARAEKPQIYLLPLLVTPGGESRALTSQAYGATSPEWSPDGHFIAYLAGCNAEERAKEDSGEKEDPPADKFDAEQRKATKQHVEEKRWDPRPVERIPYRAGTSFLDDRFQQVYVIPTSEKLEGDAAKPRRLTDVDASHTPPRWSSDGKYLYTSRTIDPEADEHFRFMRLYRIRVEDKAQELLLDEGHSDIDPLVSPDGKWLVFDRQRVPLDALSLLMVMPTAGGAARPVNVEIDRSPFSADWTPDNKLVVNFGSWGDSDFQQIDPDSGKAEQIFTGRMAAEGLGAGPGGFAFTAATPANPGELYWFPTGADEPLQFTEFNQKFLDEVVVQEVHELRYNSPNGEVQGWYILPVGYEEGQQYPLAFNIHGGPHAMWGPSTRTMWHEWQLHAASGYAVFFANPRGSDGYGEAFTQALHSDWGEVAFVDLMAGIDTLLEKFDFVDPDRMAVTGGSYGGYMTAWVVGHTDRFKAAVSQRGVYNLVGFYGVTDVPILISDEFDTEPWADPVKLWQHSPLAYADKIKTPLLLIASENDFRVPIAEAEQLFAFVRRSGGTVKLLRYPRDGHELSRSGEPEHRVSRLTEMVDWFDKYCKGWPYSTAI